MVGRTHIIRVRIFSGNIGDIPCAYAADSLWAPMDWSSIFVVLDRCPILVLQFGLEADWTGLPLVFNWKS